MSPTACPCGSNQSFEECCAPLLNGCAGATTAEALMRSRYTACCLHNVGYLIATAHPRNASASDPADLHAWLANKTWHKLEILDVRKGGPKDKLGRVAFRAMYEERGAQFWHKELSRFERLNGSWYYVDGQHA